MSNNTPLPKRRRPAATANRVPENLKEQDHQGNIRQNITNQGHQQDR